MNTLDLPIDAHVVGHSWGAMIAAELPGAGVRPRRLVLLDPPVLSKADLEAMVADPSDSTYPDLETATLAVRAANPTWSEQDVHWKAEALTQLEEAAARRRPAPQRRVRRRAGRHRVTVRRRSRDMDRPRRSGVRRADVG